MSRIRIALVGVGKIARDQHVPALAGNDHFELVAAASRTHRLWGVRHFPSIEALLDGMPDLDAVAICTPPQVRYEIARLALEHDKHVLLEKPPGTTLDEVQSLVELGEDRGLALFASWHSRAAAAVEPARRLLAERNLDAVTVTWKEDVRVWHPGQDWIWKAGGLGVFDPGINALSILTHILPGPLILGDARLAFPSNCETPIAGSLQMQCNGRPVRMELDFLQPGPPSWEIDIATAEGLIRLSKGGAVLQIGNDSPIEVTDREYAKLYETFAKLVRERKIDVDCAPLRLVGDALLCGRRTTVDPFVP